MAFADPTVSIQQAFTHFVATDPRNTLPPALGGGRIFDAPLMGIARAYDPFFKAFKNPEIIGPIFKTPREWLADASHVFSYFLPFTKEIRESNREGWNPSPEWVSGRIEGESFNQAARAFLIDVMQEDLGAKALAPGLDWRYSLGHLVSNWSERHVAFVAGLGTFGLHRGLITEKGTAGRFGSVITDLHLRPSQRPYEGIHDYCPFLTSGQCGVCISRCLINSITPDGKDNGTCCEHIENRLIPMCSTPDQVRFGCGKCNVGVPCEAGIPFVE